MIHYRIDKRFHVLGAGVQSVSSLWPTAATGNWWEAGSATGCIAAYQPKGAASYAASLNDLSGSANHATEGTAPGWDSTNGWQFNGTDDYLISVDISHTYTVFVQFSGVSDSSAARAIFGYYGAPNLVFRIQPSRSNVVRYGDNFSGPAPGMASGNLAMAATTGYRNGSSDQTSVPVYTGTGTMYIGCLKHVSLGATNFIAANVQALAVYDNTLDGTKVAAVAAAMAAL